MSSSTESRSISLYIPEDINLLSALGKVALHHAHLDHILRMTIKTLGIVTVEQALDATAFISSSGLRDRIKKLAKQKLGEGNALIRLQAILERCRRATEKRNDYIHNIWAYELDTLTKEFNHARVLGFISEALAVKGST